MKLFIPFLMLIVITQQALGQSAKIELTGSVKVGDSQDPNPVAGTIRWNGFDIEGFNGVEWVSLTDGKSGPVTDVDGNVYPTTTIGNQTWMAENLRTSRYRNGDVIPNVTSSATWITLADGAYCWYDNSSSHEEPYGKMYNWHAVNRAEGLCPEGWKVPGLEDWTTLAEELGGDVAAGGLLKEAGTMHWNDPNTGATNSTAFTALPGGSRSVINGDYLSLGTFGFHWTSTEDSGNAARGRMVWFQHNSAKLTLGGASDKKTGMSVRCIKE